MACHAGRHQTPLVDGSTIGTDKRIAASVCSPLPTRFRPRLASAISQRRVEPTGDVASPRANQPPDIRANRFVLTSVGSTAVVMRKIKAMLDEALVSRAHHRDLGEAEDVAGRIRLALRSIE